MSTSTPKLTTSTFNVGAYGSSFNANTATTPKYSNNNSNNKGNNNNGNYNSYNNPYSSSAYQYTTHYTGHVTYTSTTFATSTYRYRHQQPLPDGSLGRCVDCQAQLVLDHRNIADPCCSTCGLVYPEYAENMVASYDDVQRCGAYFDDGDWSSLGSSHLAATVISEGRDASRLRNEQNGLMKNSRADEAFHRLMREMQVQASTSTLVLEESERKAKREKIESLKDAAFHKAARTPSDEDMRNLDDVLSNSFYRIHEGAIADVKEIYRTVFAAYADGKLFTTPGSKATPRNILLQLKMASLFYGSPLMNISDIESLFREFVQKQQKQPPPASKAAAGKVELDMDVVTAVKQYIRMGPFASNVKRRTINVDCSIETLVANVLPHRHVTPKSSKEEHDKKRKRDDAVKAVKIIGQNIAKHKGNIDIKGWAPRRLSPAIVLAACKLSEMSDIPDIARE
jgi:hypothetical protein